MRRRRVNLTQSLVGCIAILTMAAALIFSVGGFIFLINAARL